METEMNAVDHKGLLEGTGKILDEWLGLDKWPSGKRTQVGVRCTKVTAAKGLGGLYEGKGWRDLIEGVANSDLAGRVRELVNNFNGKCDSPQENGSAENWRWEPQLGTASTEEAKIERAIGLCGGEDWTNQVPICSGICSSHDGRVAIDLVHRMSEGTYDFIELKARASTEATPLFAAMEILRYGAVYIYWRVALSRMQGGSTCFDKNELLKARKVNFVALLPESCYRNGGKTYQFGWLEKKIDAGLKEFTSSAEGLNLGFQFRQMSDEKVGEVVRLTTEQHKQHKQDRMPCDEVKGLLESVKRGYSK